MATLLIAAALGLFAFLARYRYESAVLLVAALFPAYVIRFSVAGIPTNVLEASIIILFMVGLLHTSVRSRWKRSWVGLPKAVAALIAIFVASAAVSVFVSPHLETSLGVFKGWIVVPMLYGWMAHSLVAQKSEYGEKLLQYLIVSGFVMALFSFSQINTGAAGRLQGIYDVPNSLALYLVPITILAVFHGRRRKLNSLFAAGMFVAIVGTQSVMAAIALGAAFVAGIFMFSGVQKKKYAVIGVTGAACALSVFLFSGKIEYLTRPFVYSSASSSLSVRAQLWSVGVDLIKENPVLGVGLGAFEPAYQQALHGRFLAYGETGILPLPEFVFRDPHNWIISFWLNAGVLGLLSFIALNAAALYSGLNKKAGRTQKVAGLALASLLIFGLADTIFWKNDLAVLHWLLIVYLASSPLKPYRLPKLQ